MIVLLTNETWLICGGRDFSDQEMFDRAMDRLVTMFGFPNQVVHGASWWRPGMQPEASLISPGADAMADRWGCRFNIYVQRCPSDWEIHGKAAGPIRNNSMLRFRPNRVIAFPGGNGTSDMVRKSKGSDATVIEVVEKA